MIKTLAAATLTSLIAFAAVPAAEAKTNLNFDIGLGINLGGGGGGYPVYDPYYPAYTPVYVDHCGAARLNVKYQGFKKVRPLDCSGSRFAFKAKRHGDWWLVKTTRSGAITSVSPL